MVEQFEALLPRLRLVDSLDHGRVGIYFYLRPFRQGTHWAGPIACQLHTTFSYRVMDRLGRSQTEVHALLRLWLFGLRGFSACRAWVFGLDERMARLLRVPVFHWALANSLALRCYDLGSHLCWMNPHGLQVYFVHRKPKVVLQFWIV